MELCEAAAESSVGEGAALTHTTPSGASGHFARTAFLVLALASLLVAIAGFDRLLSPSAAVADPSRSPSLVAWQPPAGATGAQLYVKECAPCHGDGGQGSDSGPSLKAAGFSSLVTPKVRVGGGGMPVFANILSDQQIGTVSDYVAGSIADQTTHEATDAQGGSVYRLYCAACHGSTGRGGALTGVENAPVLGGTIGADALVDMIEGPAEMPVFAGTTLGLQQQTAVALYLQDVISAPPSPGGWGLGYRGPVSEGFFALFLGLGGLVLLARWAQAPRKAV